MGLFDFLRRTFPTAFGPMRLTQQRRDVPLMLDALTANLDPEQEAIEPIWGWDRAMIQAAAEAFDSGNFQQGEELNEAITRLGRESSA